MGDEKRRSEIEISLVESQRKKLIYIYTNWSTFVEKDYHIFKDKFEVKTFEFKPKKKWQTPFWLAYQALYILLNLPKTSLIVTQFAGYHSYVPVLIKKIFKVPFLIVAGGTECVAFPKLKYGNLRDNVLGKFTRWSHQGSSHIAPVDESLIFSKNAYDNEFNEHENQGIKAFIPNITTPFTTIYNGYVDPSAEVKSSKEKNSFITIAAGISQESRFILKGVDSFFEMATLRPEMKFVLVGANAVPRDVPPNVQMIPFVSNEELTALLEKAQFYVQLSVSEGFPNALCEAMLCRCVPVTSNVGAMPMIVGSNGIIVNKKDAKKTLTNIDDIQNKDLEQIGEEARKSILNRFPLNKRKTELLKLAESLVKK